MRMRKKENKQENYKAWGRRRRDRMYKKKKRDTICKSKYTNRRENPLEGNRNKIKLRTVGIKWKIMVQ